MIQEMTVEVAMNNYMNGFFKKAQEKGDPSLRAYREAIKRKSREYDETRKQEKKESKKEHKAALEAKEDVEEKDNRPALVYEGKDVVGGKKLDKEREKQDGQVQQQLDKGTAANEQAKSMQELLVGGQGDGIPDESFDQKQLSEGKSEEKEHTPNDQVATEIAKDHLAEDPKYYDKHKQMESQGKEHKQIAAEDQEVEKVSGYAMLRGEFKKKATFEEMKDENIPEIAAIGGGALAAKKGVPMIHGRTRLHHGTTEEAAKKILQEGLKGGKGGIASVIGVKDAPKHVYMDPRPAMARVYAGQAESIKDTIQSYENMRKITKNYPKIPRKSMIEEGSTVYHLTGGPLLSLLGLGKGKALKADVPLWKKEYADKLIENPELRGAKSPGEFDKILRNIEGQDRGAIGNKAFYKSLKKSKTFKDKLGPEVFRESKHFNPMTIKELKQYIKTKPGRFAGGLGLTAAGLGSAGLGIKSLLVKRKVDQPVVQETELKKAATGMKEVAVVGVIKDGKILMGKRRDNNKWTNPGGHLEEGEQPIQGAIRELKEESGIEVQPHQLSHLCSETVTKPGGEKLKVHAYRCNLGEATSTSMKEDPDGEVFRWHWVNADGRNNKEIYNNLHVPAGENVLLKALGMVHTKEASFYDFYESMGVLL